MGSSPSEGVKAEKGLSSQKQEREGPQKESKDSLAGPQAQNRAGQGHSSAGVSKEKVRPDNFVIWRGDASFPVEFREE